MKRLILFLVTILSLNNPFVYAQSLPVGFPLLEEFYRRAQLLGEIDSSVSFAARPFFPSEVINSSSRFHPDSLLRNRFTNGSF